MFGLEDIVLFSTANAHKTKPNNAILGKVFFKVCWILTEKLRLEPTKIIDLKNFASLDAQVDPQVARLVRIYSILHFVLKFDYSIEGDFSTIPKFIPDRSIYSLMTICRVLHHWSKLYTSSQSVVGFDNPNKNFQEFSHFSNVKWWLEIPNQLKIVSLNRSA